jgi:AraC family transcriptional regulator
MTLAAQELAGTDAKVIDVALRYSYDSPDSFAKAFQRFHGITPSQARDPGAPLRSLAPLHIKIILEGGNMLDYRIVEKAPFTIVGTKRTFNTDTSYQEIPKFWNEWMEQGEERPIKGTFGVCVDMKGKDFDYWIADLYFPWEDIPDGCGTKVIPGSLWAQFPCTISTLQDTNTKIWSEWLSRTKEKLNRILSENTGRPYEQVEKDTDRDNFMYAEEALAYGLIDKILVR